MFACKSKAHPTDQSLLCNVSKLRYVRVVSGCLVGASPSSRIRPKLASKRGQGAGLAFRMPGESTRKSMQNLLGRSVAWQVGVWCHAAVSSVLANPSGLDEDCSEDRGRYSVMLDALRCQR